MHHGRQEQDEYAALSQQRASESLENGYWEMEITSTVQEWVDGVRANHGLTLLLDFSLDSGDQALVLNLDRGVANARHLLDTGAGTPEPAAIRDHFPGQQSDALTAHVCVLDAQGREVFRHVGYDDQKYSGFAFGTGLERMAMLRDSAYRDAIRHCVENPNRDGNLGSTTPPPRPSSPSSSRERAASARTSSPVRSTRRVDERTSRSSSRT